MDAEEQKKENIEMTNKLLKLVYFPVVVAEFLILTIPKVIVSLPREIFVDVRKFFKVKFPWGEHPVLVLLLIIGLTGVLILIPIVIITVATYHPTNNVSVTTPVSAGN